MPREVKNPGTYKNLPARPIMVYPRSAEEREAFEEMAKEEHRRLSPFIVNVVSEYIRRKRLSQTAEGRLEATRQRYAEAKTGT